MSAGKMTEIANVINENIKSLDRIHLGENLMPSDKTYKTVQEHIMMVCTFDSPTCFPISINYKVI